MNTNVNMGLTENWNSILDTKVDKVDLDQCIDSRELNKSFFRRKSSEDNLIENVVQDFFNIRYNFDADKKDFQPIWDRIAVSNIWNSSSLLNIEKLRKIDALLKKTIIYRGTGVSETPSQAKTEIEMIVNWILHGNSIDLSRISKKTLDAIFTKKDETLLKEFRDLLQKELSDLHNKLPKTKEEAFLWRAFLGNIVSFLPYTYPKNTAEFQIPFLTENSNGYNVSLITYNIEVLKLTVDLQLSPTEALGLTPKNLDDTTSPHFLVFLGTTFPAGEGFLSTLLADFTPGYSVGERAYDDNKQIIDLWIKGKTNVHTLGTSLGGALALHTFRHHPEKISRFDVYNPPGFNKNCWKDLKNSLCEGHIYTQKHDIVSQLGFWPTEKAQNIHLYNVIPHPDDSSGPLQSHVKSFFGSPKKITVLEQNKDKVNQSYFRRLLTKVHKWVFPVTVWLPLKCTILFIKACRYLSNTASLCSKSLKKYTWTSKK